jgi:broad specificity phosphatase PhoE
MDVTELLVVRHGQSEWNAIGRWQGQADPPLSELGRRQAYVAAASIGALDGIISSDLRRALETAVIIAQQIGVGPVMIDERLRERDAGEWTGLVKSEIDKGWPGYLENSQRPPGFEKTKAMVARVVEAVDAIGAKHPGASLLVVTHGGVIRALAKSHDIEEDMPVGHLGGLTIRVSPSGRVVGERVALLDGQAVTITHNDEL